MQTLYSIADDATGDAISFETDGGRLLVRSRVEARERVVIVADGVDAGLALADALRSAFATEVS